MYVIMHDELNNKINTFKLSCSNFSQYCKNIAQKLGISAEEASFYEILDNSNNILELNYFEFDEGFLKIKNQVFTEVLEDFVSGEGVPYQIATEVITYEIIQTIPVSLLIIS